MRKRRLPLEWILGIGLLLAACGRGVRPTSAVFPASPLQASATAASLPPTRVPLSVEAPASETPGKVQLTLTAAPMTLSMGECTTVRWQVSGPHFDVWLNDKRVPDEGSRRACLTAETTFVLRVDAGVEMLERRIDIQVHSDATPPMAYTPPTIGDVPYLTVDGETLGLDMYIPKGQGPFPVVVYIHGGGFIAGDRGEGVVWAPYLLSWGYAVVSVDYRLAPQHPFPAAIADVQCALAWLGQHGAEYRLDPQRLALAGQSAGGHLAALAGMANEATDPAPPWQPSCGQGPFPIRAVISHSGPMDLAETLKTVDWAVEAFVGSPCTPPKVCAQASPLTYVHAGAPPVLLFHGSADSTVSVTNAREMKAALESAGVPLVYVEVEGAEHTFPLRARDFETLQQFLDRYLKP